MTTQQALPAGTLLHNGIYQIQELISSNGGFGLTYKAVNITTNQLYAIKEFFWKGFNTRIGTEVTVSVPENTASYDKLKAKFMKEASRLMELNHPNIIKVYEWFEENGTGYYVMDFIDGESLDGRLKRTEKPMKKAEIIALLESLLSALEVVHEKGLMHMDLKPSNIMIDENEHITLIDFGASKQMTPEEQKTLATTTGLAYINGYAPGEQIMQNLRNIGPWTDFYALGATLYKLQTLQSPPRLDDIMNEREIAFSFPPRMSVAMKSLIVWMMTPERKQRPQSVSEIRERIAKMRRPLKKEQNNATTVVSEQTVFEEPQDEQTILLDSDSTKQKQKSKGTRKTGTKTKRSSTNRQRSNTTRDYIRSSTKDKPINEFGTTDIVILFIVFVFFIIISIYLFGYYTS